MAVLVVLGLGGLVLWYLTKTPAQRPLTTQGQPPCAVSVSGISATCGALEKGLGLVTKYGEAIPGMLGNILNPLGFGSDKPISYPEFAKWKTGVIASGGTPPTGCGGWRGPCPPPPVLQQEPQAYNPALANPVGFR